MTTFLSQISFLRQIISQLKRLNQNVFAVSIFHLNIRSLKKNFDKLVDFLATLSFNLRSSLFLKHGVLVNIIIAISIS